MGATGSAGGGLVDEEHRVRRRLAQVYNFMMMICLLFISTRTQTRTQSYVVVLCNYCDGKCCIADLVQHHNPNEKGLA